MKPIRPRDLLCLHLEGYALLCIQGAGFAFLATTALFILGLTAGLVIPVGGVMAHLFLGFLLMTLFPGQMFWTVRVTDRHGQPRTVVGPLSELELYHGEAGLNR